jgi:hypothetical protein
LLDSSSDRGCLIGCSRAEKSDMMRRMVIGVRIVLGLGGAAAFSVAALHAEPAPIAPASQALPAIRHAEKMQDPEFARSSYVEHCAGCHGVAGSSIPANLPELKDRVGWFMCTPAARAYLLRLPNVAHSRIADNETLADLMNFVVFELGGNSVPAGTKPFTGPELAYERQFALIGPGLKAERARLTKDVIRKCRAPASLSLQYPHGPK